MDPFSLGLGLLSTGLNFFGNQSNTDAQMANNALQRASNEKIAADNIANQREFAQHGVSWKVNDARDAGINPLAALGANTVSYSPQAFADVGPAPKPGNALSDMGQDLTRAFKAASSAGIREEKDAADLRKLELEKASLQNDVLKQELNSRQMRFSRLGGNLGPPLPVAHTISANEPVKSDDIKQKAEDYPATRIVRPFGYPLIAAPALSDGQQFEDRYGDSEIGSTIKFGVNTIADHAYTGYKWVWPKLKSHMSRIPSRAWE